jgi:hypothetical protein
MLKVLLLSSALALTAASAEAATVFTDNFNSDTPSLNSTGDAFFLSTSPSYNKPNEASIDIIGSGPSGTSFDILPGNGYYVDLDGSSGYGNKPLAGQLTYKGTFAPGNYVLTFDLAGNQRGAGAQTTEVLAGTSSTTFALIPSSQGFTTETIDFTATATSNILQFDEIGPLPTLGSDQQGNLLDNVSVISAVPEPATWAMMILGFFGMAFAIRSNRRSNLRLA